MVKKKGATSKKSGNQPTQQQAQSQRSHGRSPQQQARPQQPQSGSLSQPKSQTPQTPKNQGSKTQVASQTQSSPAKPTSKPQGQGQSGKVASKKASSSGPRALEYSSSGACGSTPQVTTQRSKSPARASGSTAPSVAWRSTPPASDWLSTPPVTAQISKPPASASGSTALSGAWKSTPPATAQGSKPPASASDSTAPSGAWGSNAPAAARPHGSNQQKEMAQSSSHPSSQPSEASSPSTPTKQIPTSALMPVTQNIGCGTKGGKVTVDVNFVALSIEKLLDSVYQYDVSIEPELPKSLLPRIFEAYRQKNYNDICIAYDGRKIAVSPKMLPITDNIEKETRILNENGRERVYMVSVKEARDSKIDFQSLKNYTSMRKYDAPLRAMQMLEIVLKSPFLNLNGVQAGRSFYLRPEARHDLGDNYELWTGLYQ